MRFRQAVVLSRRRGLERLDGNDEARDGEQSRERRDGNY